MAPTKTELIDLAWRCLWTFIQTFLAVLLTMPMLSDVDLGDEVVVDISGLGLAATAAFIAAVAAVGSVVKTYASNKLGTGTATQRAQPAIGRAPVASIATQHLP